MTPTTTELTTANAQIEIEANDHLLVSDGDRAAGLTVSHPSRSPLSAGEEHARIQVATEDGSVTLRLDGDELDALRAGLADCEAFHDGEEVEA